MMRVSHYIKKWFPVFALPTFLCFILAFIVPFAMGLYLSFTSFRTVNDATWVGLDNYVRAFTQNGDFLASLWFTVKFTVVSVITVNVLGFTVAMLLTRAIRGRNVFRAVFFLPNLIGGIVLGYIWQLILNAILQAMFHQDLTYSATYGFWGLVILVNWQMVGYMMVIYIAGIQNIPTDVLEAADIDGARFRHKLFSVIIPMMAGSITICTFLTLSNCLKMFDQNLALTNGAPQNQSEGAALNIFRVFYKLRNQQGVGQAEAVIFFVFVAVVAYLQLRATRSKEVDA
ncbi:MAG: sugar ABC transporter permease [Propionibacteriaceae bacterium]|jgi:raffinose/stachyose/melibiose transport system permease protein|nr:sugar ABC transporter permease [Propionibacteriaceae bacterium]